MKRILPAEELARDERFARVTLGQRMTDQRGRRNPGTYGSGERDDPESPEPRPERSRRMDPFSPNGPERARGTMHGIFMGEIQALEGAGRTAWDFTDDEAPYHLKLDMARQCWDEARHVEISVKLCAWMGTEIGEFAESTF